MRGWRETNSDSDWDFIWAERYRNVVCAVSSCYVRGLTGFSPVLSVYGEGLVPNTWLDKKSGLEACTYGEICVSGIIGWTTLRIQLLLVPYLVVVAIFIQI